MKLRDILRLSEQDIALDGIRILGNADIDIQGLNLCNRASEKDRILSYATSEKYAEQVRKGGHIVALVVSFRDAKAYEETITERNGCLVMCQYPEVAFYAIHEALCKTGGFYPGYDFPPQIGVDCSIAPSAVIENGVVIGNRVTVGANAVICPGSIIDDGVVIGRNVTIGGEGFQIIRDIDYAPMRITHVGKCHICAGASIGDNACVCNSLFEGETYVGHRSRLDALVHCAHNVYVGAYVGIAACAQMCGSARIEDEAWIGPQVSVLNRVTVGKRATIGLGSVVTRNIPAYALAYGAPAKVHRFLTDEPRN